MTVRGAKFQRGVALIALLAVIALAASWFLVKQLNTESGAVSAARKSRNAEVLNRAKQALIGYVAQRSAQSTEKDPGRLPCPEAPGYFDSSTNQGVAAGNCTLPAVGRLPWRTLGLDKLVDAAGEPLWFVVSPGWALLPPGTPATLMINSNTVGQLTIDNVANDSVALIIAPGPAFTVAAAGTCSAWPQTRPSSGVPDVRNYLECENAAGATFVTTGTSASFNDQVVRVTIADIMPTIEAAVATRIEREIVPQLKSVYGTAWGQTATNPVYPYPAPFVSPTTPTTSDYQGMSAASCAATSCEGLLPFTSNCTTAGDPRCSSTFVAWNTAITPTVVQTGGSGTLLPLTVSCGFISGGTRARCSGDYLAVGSIDLLMSASASNVAMALRKLDTAGVTAEYSLSGWTSVTATASGALSSNGSGTIGASGSFPSSLSPSISFRITMDISMLADHTLLDSSNSTTGWFVRNEWYRLAYYAVAKGYTAVTLPSTPACTNAVNCLTVTNVTPTAAQRAILVLAGRSINGSPRPSATLGDYFESGNATAAYTRMSVNGNVAVPLSQRFNDRVVVIDTN